MINCSLRSINVVLTAPQHKLHKKTCRRLGQKTILMFCSYTTAIQACLKGNTNSMGMFCQQQCQKVSVQLVLVSILLVVSVYILLKLQLSGPLRGRGCNRGRIYQAFWHTQNSVVFISIGPLVPYSVSPINSIRPVFSIDHFIL